MVLGFWKQRSGITDDATGQEYEILGIGGSWFGVERQVGGADDGLIKFAWQRDWFDMPSTAHTFLDDRRGRQGARDAAQADVGQRPRACPATTATRTSRRRVWPPPVERGRLRHPGAPGATHDALPPAAQQLIDGKLVAASDGATYPILNPATGPGDRAGAGRHRRRRRGGDRRGPSGLRRDRLVDRTSSSGCAACASCTRRCSTTPRTFRALTTAEVGMPGVHASARPASTCRSRG